MSRIRRNRLRRTSHMNEEEVNPMEGVVNIVDAMLVFACGLMLSIVIYWNVDLTTNEMTPITQGTEVTDPESIQEQLDAGEEGNFEEVGKVFRDPVTGKLYLAEDLPAGSDSNESDADNTGGE